MRYALYYCTQIDTSPLYHQSSIIRSTLLYRLNLRRMVKAVKGAVVQCDEAMKQLLLKLNAEQEPFIVEDLDETHVLIDRSSVDRLKEKFAMALEENVYKLSDGQEVKSTW